MQQLSCCVEKQSHFMHETTIKILVRPSKIRLALIKHQSYFKSFQEITFQAKMNKKKYSITS